MLISNEWLKDYVNVDRSVQALAERITRLELKSMILLTIQKILKLVVGHVLSKTPHQMLIN